ncbi:hypothetical protein BO78DRAFT_357992 [Aspergillus sclerotiicarbonarius CBS 121057]|uniref:Uncharacterized protein n=1 Tax=Aspergillus sclerotiicarbonarius (strain CBS 121057 / IBT 28362) TaxID=1448318 RepID=A0A319EV81_ASPSB|nr:hypothetical protein BO78DRAFT_357992 [Aspergillus sclerotiicarbonarius CBS 121057]
MPGDDDSTQNRPAAPSAPDSRRWPDDENPFVAFRRFADEQLSSMLQSVMGIPSMSSRPSPDHWAIFDEEARFRKKDNSEAKGDDHAPADTEHPSHHKNRHPSRSWTEWEDNWHADHPRGRRTDQDFFESFLDRSWFDGPFSSRFFHPHHRPMFSGFASNASTWPLTYLLFSPYSPLHLERQEYYQSHHDRGVFSSLVSSLSLSESDSAEAHWREAFEDLIRLENGKLMLDHDSTALVKRETARDWLYGLAKRGSLGDQWKISEFGGNDWSSPMTAIRQFHSKDDDREIPKNRTVDEETEALTELDMFDRFFEDAAAHESKAFADAFESPILRFLLEERQRSRDTPSDDTENWLEFVSGGRNNSIPDAVPEKQQPASETQVVIPSHAQPTAEKPTVISTMTRTERIRLPDGSTQKKTVWTKKFADGREESNETVEVLNPPQTQDSPNQEKPASDQKNTGWFWRD